MTDNPKNFDLFDKKQNLWDLYQDFYNFNSKEDISKNEVILEKRNKDFDKKFISLYTIHSSKYHLTRDGNKNNLNEIFKNEIKSLKEKNNINNKNHNTSKINEYTPRGFDYKNKNAFRKKMAFHYRFMNNSTYTKFGKKKFKSQNKEMKKILQISKSIPDVLLLEIQKMQKNIKNIDNNYEHIKKIEEEYLYNTNKAVKGYGFSSPFKGNRYIGNLYDYYKSNKCLNEVNFIPSESKYNNDNDNNKNNEHIKPIKEEKKNTLSQIDNKKSKNKKIINRNENISILKNKTNSKIGIIELNSLLL